MFNAGIFLRLFARTRASASRIQMPPEPLLLLGMAAAPTSMCMSAGYFTIVVVICVYQGICSHAPRVETRAAKSIRCSIRSPAPGMMINLKHAILTLLTCANLPPSYGTVWLDIEGPQYWMDQGSNQAFFSGLIGELQNRGANIGVYTVSGLLSDRLRQ